MLDLTNSSSSSSSKIKNELETRNKKLNHIRENKYYFVKNKVHIRFLKII